MGHTFLSCVVLILENCGLMRFPNFHFHWMIPSS
jgi:hypothetical protein